MMQNLIFDISKIIPRWTKIQKLSGAPLHTLYTIVIEGKYQDDTKIAQRLNIKSLMVVLI